MCQVLVRHDMLSGKSSLSNVSMSLKVYQMPKSQSLYLLL